MKTSIGKAESMFGFPDNHRISSRVHVFFGPTAPPFVAGQGGWRPRPMYKKATSQMKRIREREQKRKVPPLLRTE